MSIRLLRLREARSEAVTSLRSRLLVLQKLEGDSAGALVCAAGELDRLRGRAAVRAAAAAALDGEVGVMERRLRDVEGTVAADEAALEQLRSRHVLFCQVRARNATALSCKSFTHLHCPILIKAQSIKCVEVKNLNNEGEQLEVDLTAAKARESALHKVLLNIHKCLGPAFSQ